MPRNLISSRVRTFSVSSIARYAKAMLGVAAAALFLSVPAHATDKKADLSRLVVVGDSLSAGFQNFSLFDGQTLPMGFPPAGQRQGYANLVAQQAGTPLTLPLIAYPGIPPALNFVGGQIVPATGIGYRLTPITQATNLSVPGFSLADALYRPFPGSPTTNAIDALSASILGLVPKDAPLGCGPFPTLNGLAVSELACAIALKPTTVIVNVGNNDALQALTFGLQPTNPAIFELQFRVLLTSLASTGASVLVANIPDVTTIPFLIPASQFSAVCGNKPLPAGVGPDDYLVPDITSTTGFSVCTNPAIRPASLIATTSSAVAKYNMIIAREARLTGASVVDFNGLFAKAAKNGYKLKDRTLTNAFLGGLFSLDGIHPTNTGYAILANEVIKNLKTDFKVKIDEVDVDAVAATDPFVPQPSH